MMLKQISLSTERTVQAGRFEPGGCLQPLAALSNFMAGNDSAPSESFLQGSDASGIELAGIHDHPGGIQSSTANSSACKLRRHTTR